MTDLDLRAASSRVTLEQDDARTVVRPHGQIDVTCAAEFRERLVEADSSGAQTVVVDLSDASFGDSYGVVLLLRASIRASNRGAKFILGSPCQQSWRMLYATGLIRHFTIDRCP